MSLKTNFLIIISIVVLTIFVKMVPAPKDRENSEAITSQSEDRKNSEAITSPSEDEEYGEAITSPSEDRENSEAITSQSEDEEYGEAITSPSEDQENSEAITTPPEVHRNNLAEMTLLPERNSIEIGMYDNIRNTQYPNKHIVSCEQLYEFNEMNKMEIVIYSEKTDIKTRLEEQPDIAATILYIKDTLKRYNTYYPDLSIGSNVFINYSSTKNNKDDPKLMKEMTEFKNIKERDLRGLFQAVTSCYLIADDQHNKILIPSTTLYDPADDNTFKDTFFLNQFRFFYNLSNAEISVIGGKPHVSVKHLLNIVKNDDTDIKKNVTYVDKYHLEFNSDTYLLFVKTYIKELHSHDPLSFPMDALSPEDIELMMQKFNDDEYNRITVFSVKKYLVDQYIQFTSIWQLYRFDINVYLKYKIIDASFGNHNYDEIMLNEIDGVKMTALEAFKKYFKESLDDSYNIVINMDINNLDDSKKTIYYKRTLRTLKNIFQAHFKETDIESTSKFVQRMIIVAEAILNSDETKQIPVQLKKEYLSYKDVCPKPQKPESDHKSETTSDHKPTSEENDDKITIQNNYYTCDSTRCGLPHTVNCKDILNYMIARYEKNIHEYIIGNDNQIN